MSKSLQSAINRLRASISALSTEIAKMQFRLNARRRTYASRSIKWRKGKTGIRYSEATAKLADEIKDLQRVKREMNLALRRWKNDA